MRKITCCTTSIIRLAECRRGRTNDRTESEGGTNRIESAFCIDEFYDRVRSGRSRVAAYSLCAFPRCPTRLSLRVNICFWAGQAFLSWKYCVWQGEFVKRGLMMLIRCAGQKVGYRMVTKLVDISFVFCEKLVGEKNKIWDFCQNLSKNPRDSCMKRTV